MLRGSGKILLFSPQLLMRAAALIDRLIDSKYCYVLHQRVISRVCKTMWLRMLLFALTRPANRGSDETRKRRMGRGHPVCAGSTFDLGYPTQDTSLLRTAHRSAAKAAVAAPLPVPPAPADVSEVGEGGGGG